jgi:hypothetical protein
MTSSPVEPRRAERSLDLDPMRPEVQALFCGLSAERELVARLALNALCWRCGGAPQWRARVEELWVGVVRKPRDLRRVLRRAEALEREIAQALTPNATDLHMVCSSGATTLMWQGGDIRFCRDSCLCAARAAEVTQRKVLQLWHRVA